MPWVRHPRSRVDHFLLDGRTLCERFTEDPAKPLDRIPDDQIALPCSVCRRLLAEHDPTAKLFFWTYENRDFCRGCGMLVEWWMTPNLRWMPINPESWRAPERRELLRLTAYLHQGMLDRCHFRTCPDTYLFSGRRADVAGREDAALERYEQRKGGTHP